MFCAYTRPRYQVSVYRTFGPLVIDSVGFLIGGSHMKHFTIILYSILQKTQQFTSTVSSICTWLICGYILCDIHHEIICLTRAVHFDLVDFFFKCLQLTRV